MNGESYVCSTQEDFDLTGVHGLLISGKTLSWRPIFTLTACPAIRLCPVDHASLQGPWGDDPWTCTTTGESCTLPFVCKGVSHSTCTQQFSDVDDADDDGSLHNGHPQCQSTFGLNLCGPCSCAAGEEQTYNSSRVYPHTPAVNISLVQLGDLRASSAMALWTPASSVGLAHPHPQEQLHVRPACQVCSMITRC